MTTIDSLPLEILIRILELAAEHDISDRRAHRATRRMLSAASLVAQRWREPAQAKVWRRLLLHGWGEAGHVVSSPLCGELRTAAVVLHPYGDPGGLTVEGVLGKLKGLVSVELTFYGEGGIDTAWLNLASLSGAADAHSVALELQLLTSFVAELTTLRLDAAFQAVDPGGLHPAFHLHKLEIHHRTSPPSP